MSWGVAQACCESCGASYPVHEHARRGPWSPCQHGGSSWHDKTSFPSLPCAIVVVGHLLPLLVPLPLLPGGTQAGVSRTFAACPLEGHWQQVQRGLSIYNSSRRVCQSSVSVAGSSWVQQRDQEWSGGWSGGRSAATYERSPQLHVLASSLPCPPQQPGGKLSLGSAVAAGASCCHPPAKFFAAAVTETLLRDGLKPDGLERGVVLVCW